MTTLLKGIKGSHKASFMKNGECKQNPVNKNKPTGKFNCLL